MAHGLNTNRAVKKLEMKGNNIRGTAAEALGKMLRCNDVLLRCQVVLNFNYFFITFLLQANF